MTNFSLTSDESVSALLAGRINQGFRLAYPSGLYEVRDELYWYILSLWTRLTGINEPGLRILSSLFGILAIAAIYLAGKMLYDKKTALIASFFYAFFPPVVSLARYARMYSMWMFFLTIMFYLFLKGKRWLAILVFLASYFIHRGSLVFVPGILLAIALLKEPVLKKLLYMIAVTIVIFIISLHLFHNPRLNVSSAGADESNKSFIRPSFKGASFYAGVLAGAKRDYIKNELGEIGKKRAFFDLSKFLIFSLFLLGFIDFKKEDILLYGTFITALFIMSFFVSWKWERYLAGLYPFLLIGSARGCEVLRKNPFMMRYRLRPVWAVFIFLLGLNPLGNAAIFQKKNNWIPDFKGAYQYIRENAGENDTLVATEVPPALFYSGKIDCFSQEKDHMIFLYRDAEGNVRERYSGKGVIDNENKWLEVVKENEKVWFVTDIIKFPYKFSDETISLIYDKFDLVKCFYLVKIFRYEKGMKENYIATPEKEDLVPLEAKFYYYSADSMIKKGNVEGAVKCFQMSRRINPYYLLPYWRLGEIYTNVGLVEEGFREYEKAYEMDKRDPLAKKFFEEAKNDLSERGIK